MDMERLSRRPGDLRRALKKGHTVPLTFHHKPFAAVIPEDILGRLLELAGDKGRELFEATLVAGETPEEAAA
ncbi:hypothetical protein ACFQ68_13415 [Amycolatopsis japonica]|uniref:hypothetical protein n=1 Tax=Amycolatopsis japonica TaxID=208439 RepID=UPI00366D1D57